MRSFQLIALTPPGLTDPAVAIAASQSGAWGVLDLEYCNESSALEATNELARSASGLCGVKLSGRRKELLSLVVENLPQRIGMVILTAAQGDEIGTAVQSLLSRGVSVLWESLSVESAERGARLGVHGIIAKGNEAGGYVGDETSFVLSQHVLMGTRLPVWIQGGVGLLSAAACYAAGAAGVVLDSQLWLTGESNLPEVAKSAIEHMDGSETVCLGGGFESSCRMYWRPGRPVLEGLRKTAESLTQSSQSQAEKLLLWQHAVEHKVGWSSNDQVWLLGQDACFAASLGKRFKTVRGVISAILESTTSHLDAAQKFKPLNENSPMAVSHGTRYPIVQGPMTRVSDTAEFADAVATGGGLPFLALALMRAPEADSLLSQTTGLLSDKPWGVGILGFVPTELRQEQLEVVRKYRPKFALIAGGRPDQARVLEQEGIVTYLHVPSPGLLRMFLENGSRHFVFEGRECGGHVGPRSSFVLWESMIEVLLESLPQTEAAKCHVLFAGGIHDGLSGAMVAAMAATLAERGVKIGVLLGTAYLFTTESVKSGAIVRNFQREALRCDRTVLLETGPGHAIRCVPTPYVDYFEQQKRHLEATTSSPEEARVALEMLNVGRLRIASKGINRTSFSEKQKDVAEGFIRLSKTEQRQDGMYMIGQVAALRKDICTIQQLHHSVSVNSTERLMRVPAFLAQGSATHSQDVAIIGMACILPKAGDLRAYWENIIAKVDAITEVPKERWDWRKYYDPDPSAPDKSYSKWGGFLDDVPFDPLNYGIPPNSLSSIEPLQLLTLEVARRALDHAGYKTRPFPRERASVILGVGGGGADLAQRYGMRVAMAAANSDSEPEAPQDLPKWTEDSFPGMLSNVAAGRVANRFDFGGVNYTIDAACASSLAAVYHAVKELEAGTSDLVLAGGSDTVQSPFAYVCFSKTHAFSFQGRCRTFDESADGIAISEGVAVLVLKRLSDAQRDGDRVYAVIKGIAGSSDGRDKSLTAPRVEGQLLALQRAYTKARISPGSVKLIEAHGTGTVAGDQAEIEALTRLFKSSGVPKESCAVGSVKSLIGHTKATAGVAGLIKASLALYHKVLPPTGGVEKPNSKARFPESPFYVNSELRPWMNDSAEQPRRAGVSAFGFGGTNFHAVLEEYTGNGSSAEAAPGRHWPSELFVWVSKSKEEMISVLANLERLLSETVNLELCALASVLWQRTKKDSATINGATRLRLAIVASSIEDLRQKLQIACENLRNRACSKLQDPRGIYFTSNPLAADGHVAFLFPGQGSQYVGMLRDLAIQFPEVRKQFELGDRALRAELSTALSSYVFPPPTFTPQELQIRQKNLTETNIAQPALGAAGLAMFRLLGSLGLRPYSVAGHSYGEYVALCAAGVFTEQMLMKISQARGRLIREGTTSESGTMAAVDTNAASVRDLLRGLDDVWVANLNSPRQTTIAGTSRAVENACQRIKAAGIPYHPLPVACAFHSPIISGVKERLAEWLAQVEFVKPSLPVFSNSTARPYSESVRDFANILAEHMVRPVDFAGEINAMYEAGARIFVEVGPRNVLTGLTSQILGDRPHLAVATDVSGRPGLPQLQLALGELFAHAVPMQLDRLFVGRVESDLELDELLAQSRKRTLSPTTWMVNGGRAYPIAQTAKTSPSQAPVSAAAYKPKVDPATSVPAHNFPPAQSQREPQTVTGLTPQVVGKLTPPPARTTTTAIGLPGNGGSAAVMMRFNQLMSRFLVTQKEVMLSCLDSGNGHTTTQAKTIPAVDTNTVAVHAIPAITTNLSDPAPQHRNGENAQVPEPKVAVPESEVEQPAKVGSNTMDEPKLTAELLKVVNERTGYPEDMLALDVDIEAELGIDSIKRVEILSVFVQNCLPSTVQLDMEELTKLRTFQAIIKRTFEALTENGNDAHEVIAASSVITDGPPMPLGDEADLARFVMASEDAQLSYVPPHKFPKSVILITDDERGLAQSLKEELSRYQVPVALLRMREGFEDSGDTFSANLADSGSVRDVVKHIRDKMGNIAGLIHLLPFCEQMDFDAIPFSECKKRLQVDVKSFFSLAQAISPDLLAQTKTGVSWLCAPIDLHAMIAADRTSPLPAHGALRGLLKTLAIECPGVVCKAIGVDQNRKASEIAGSIISEMAAGNQEVEIGFEGHRRFVLRPKRVPLSMTDHGTTLDSSSVILITGGARGITAEVACALAKHKPTLILVGRSPVPPAEESELTVQLSTPAELKKCLIDRIRQESSGRATPMELESAYRTLMHEREIRKNLATLRQAGATVQYVQADVRDESHVRGFLEQIYRTYGRIDGVIHGAGIIEDKLFPEKTSESFDRVFDTKVDSALLLGRLLRPESLKFFVLFSSISGVFGNRGQVDYAAANAAMDSIAAFLDRKWPARVVSINWGPWDKVGMVSDLVRTQMMQRGVQLIPEAAGVRALEQEIQCGKKGEVQVVLGTGPWDISPPASKQISSLPHVTSVISSAILATA
jgi:acyl transferase domain-containing protein/NAD(P)H-dependent flavin oxidoreductase YrpB (nitropropane dioxygenase family)/NAD(P)-dependent dehydrogenase (short-subunit alcohol dehydrogenase family)